MNTFQNIRPGSGSGGGVTTLNSLTGDINIVAGSGITVTPSGSNITIAATGTSGIASINADTTSAQVLAVGTTGTDFALVNNGTGTHTFNLPTASASNRGALSSTDWNTFNNKQAAGSYITALTGDIIASGPGSATSTLKEAVSKRYIDFLNGNDSGTGSIVEPWKTLNHAYITVTDASINKPYVFFLSGGNNDTDGPITAKPNISLTSDYAIQIAPSFTISGGTTNDGCTFTNITFDGAFSWIRNDNSAIGVTFNNCSFFNGPVVKQEGAGTCLALAINSTFVNSEWQLPNGGLGDFVSCNFLGSTTFQDPGASGISFLQFDGGYSSGAMSISGFVNPVYFTGFVHDVAFGASLTFITTGSGTPVVEFDSNGLTPTYTGSPTLDYLSFAKYESYTPSTPANWNSVPVQVAQALDELAATHILALSSNPSVGGAVSEALTVPGLLTTDTILSVTQKTLGAATRTSLPLIGWNTVVTNGLTAEWVGDPGPGAVVVVAIKR